MRWTQSITPVAIAASAILAGCAPTNEVSTDRTTPPPPPTTMEAANRGDALADFAKSAYETQCLSCHGVTGAGDGKMVAMLSVKPRSFSEPTWRYVDLAAGDETARADIERVIREGIPDAMMPGYATTYSPEQITALAEYVLRLRRQALGG